MSYDTQIRNSRILLVDDAVASVTVLENVLQRLGYKNVRSLTDSREVFGTFVGWRPDVIVLDLTMPYLSGIEVLELLRSQETEQDAVPVMVLTGDIDPTTKRKALVSGATEFMSKPPDISEFVLRVRNLLLMRLLQSELRDQNRLLEDTVAARTKALTERTEQLEGTLSELKETQKQLMQQERFRAFSEMASGVAHDFNNALTCVIGYTDLILTSPAILEKKETVLQFMRAMNTAGTDASQIVARLRNFYRPREETEVFTVSDLNAIVREVVPLTKPKWKAQALATGREIEVREDLSEISHVACNPSEIREVIINLLFNAVDAMPKGGTVTLQTRQSGIRVSIGVSDTGTGMTDEVRQRCMEPFFSTKEENGTGLGLAMVFGIIKRHEGTVEIQTELDKGTTFWVHLTAQASHADTPDDADASVVRPLLVLAVDDERMTLDVIERYLQADGHQVVSAMSGREALAKLGEHRFDLVITDHAMPGMTGAQLAATISRSERRQPVIMMTGCTEPGFDSSELPHGVDVLLNKAIGQKDLRRAILQVIGAEG